MYTYKHDDKMKQQIRSEAALSFSTYFLNPFYTKQLDSNIKLLLNNSYDCFLLVSIFDNCTNCVYVDTIKSHQNKRCVFFFFFIFCN